MAKALWVKRRPTIPHPAVGAGDALSLSKGVARLLVKEKPGANLPRGGVVQQYHLDNIRATGGPVAIARTQKEQSMYYTYTTSKCSNCNKTLSFKYLKIYGFIRVTSGLGPNTLICSACNTKMITTNKEWRQMSFAEKCWYVVLSTFYGIMLGFITSVFVGVTVGKIFGYTLPTNLAGLFIVAPMMLIIFGIQLTRVLLSIERTENNQESVKIVNFWDWETNLQFYGMVWFLLMILGAVPFFFMKK